MFLEANPQLQSSFSGYSFHKITELTSNFRELVKFLISTVRTVLRKSKKKMKNARDTLAAFASIYYWKLFGKQKRKHSVMILQNQKNLQKPNTKKM